MLPAIPGLLAMREGLTGNHPKTTLLVNAVTFTPGTVGIESIGRHLYVHILDLRDEDWLEGRRRRSLVMREQEFPRNHKNFLRSVGRFRTANPAGGYVVPLGGTTYLYSPA